MQGASLYYGLLSLPDELLLLVLRHFDLSDLFRWAAILSLHSGWNARHISLTITHASSRTRAYLTLLQGFQRLRIALYCQQ